MVLTMEKLTANVISGGSPNYQYSLEIGFSPIGTFTGLSAGLDSFIYAG